MLETWDVFTLDVWGNERDGFEVNDRSRCGTITLPPNPSNPQILSALRTAGLIRRYLKTLTIDGDPSTITIDCARTGRPGLHLERSIRPSG